MTIFFGTADSDSASVELSTFFPSNGRDGIWTGALPVAIRMFLAPRVRFWPFTLTCTLPGAEMRPAPTTCSILCFLNR
jgi:hypothetical protein